MVDKSVLKSFGSGEPTVAVGVLGDLFLGLAGVVGDALGQQVMRKPSRILRPGMVLTIEPGLYVRPSPEVPEAFWNIGIRIEDDAIVTATGCELITRDVPVEVADIEALMRG